VLTLIFVLTVALTLLRSLFVPNFDTAELGPSPPKPDHSFFFGTYIVYRFERIIFRLNRTIQNALDATTNDFTANLNMDFLAFLGCTPIMKAQVPVNLAILQFDAKFVRHYPAPPLITVSRPILRSRGTGVTPVKVAHRSATNALSPIRSTTSRVTKPSQKKSSRARMPRLF
jgi:hypothetical protein